MGAELREMINFHLTGKRSADAGAPFAGLVPALLAPYRDLAALRYDYPLVLIEGAEPGAFVDTLTGVINRLLRDIAPEGDEGARLRNHVLRLEARMRELAAGSRGVPLDELWQRAEQALLGDCAQDEAEWLGNSIATARFALRTRGLVVDCDAGLPARLMIHAWRRHNAGRGGLAEKIHSLNIKLGNLLKVDSLKQGEARAPQKLKAAMGKRHAGLFDFERMAELLDDAPPRNSLPPYRKQRVGEALGVLGSQRFFALSDDHEVYDFVFDSLAAALKAYNERLPELAAVVKAMAVAELELGNAYVEDKHDAYFDRFGIQALTAEDVMQFPSYLVCLHESECDTRDLARLIEIVTCDMPIKVLIHVSDPLGEPSSADGMPHRGSFAQQLVNTFVAGNAFVMQSPASNLYRQRDDIRKGLEYAGPAIFSVCVPLEDGETTLAPYLLAAAAHESRVFPAFSYDPAAGEGLADRFDISHNPDIEADWPRRTLRYEDDELQAVHEEFEFTPADFAVLLPGYGNHFEIAARAARTDELAGVADYVAGGDAANVDSVPAIAVVDSENALRRLVVDEKLIRVTRRCRDRWHALQELGGVHSSYARAMPPAAPDVVEQTPADEPVAVREAVPDPATAEALPAVASEASAAGGEPYIETPRCTTCDECTKRNDRMFAYDDNKQAYIKDPDAGTFRELVEAAEMCQVAIIHPGKPRNPDEPGLEELVRRAEPFSC